MKLFLNILIKILIIGALFNSLVFAKSGFEYGFQIPLGIGVGMYNFSLNKDATETQRSNYNAKLSQNAKNSYVGFDSGLLIHLGYNFQFKNKISLSLLFETGYAHDDFAFFVTNSGDSQTKTINNYIFESMVFGAYIKLNYNKLSFGMGGGIKVPLYARVSDSAVNYQNSSITRNIEIIKAQYMKSVFKVPIIPYLRLSVDYLIFSDKRLNLYLGGYIGYDFGMKLKSPAFNDNSLLEIVKQNISSLDLGFQIGIKINND